MPARWWGPFAVWDGGLGIWGGVALASLVCVWRLRRAGASVTGMMDALAPCLLNASGIGRIGNYFNQELFGTGEAGRAVVGGDRQAPPHSNRPSSTN